MRGSKLLLYRFIFLCLKILCHQQTYFTGGTEGICDWSLKCLVSLLGDVQDGHWVPISTNLSHCITARICVSEPPAYVCICEDI